MWVPLLASLVVGVCHADSQGKRLYDFGLGKRAAYTYLSEYKRLPIYNFGLGKRFDESMGSYPGGRTNEVEEDDYEEEGLKEGDFKRMKQYSFGLGKRLPNKQYSFGLGKRLDQETDLTPLLELTSDEEKRSNGGPGGHRFSFGLGKRDAGKQDLRRSMQYNFGLGKRSQNQPIHNFNV